MTFEQGGASRQVFGNPCLESCRAACCGNVFFGRLSKKDLGKLTPPQANVVEVDRTELSVVFDEIKYYQPGVYVSKAKGVFSAVVVGRCPNLQTDNRCGIYETRPKPCMDFVPGKPACIIVRHTLGLKPLPNP